MCVYGEEGVDAIIPMVGCRDAWSNLGVFILKV